METPNNLKIQPFQSFSPQLHTHPRLKTSSGIDMLNLEVHAALVKQGAELLVKTPGQRVQGYIK